MPSAESDVVFGRHRIDRTEARLYRGADPVALRPKAWELLTLLVSRPNALFGFEELNDRLWPDTIVAPHALTKLVGDLRRALGADGAAHIENVPRRGYRFLIRDASLPHGEPSTAASPSFVAREKELAQLASCWQRTLNGQRQFVFLSGETGIGKTTLVDHFLRGLGATDGESEGGERGGAPVLVARGQCVPLLGEPVPYGPIVEALQRIAMQRSVVARLRQYAPAWLLQLRGVLSVEESKELLAVLAGSGAQRMLNEAAVLLEAIAGETPLVVVVEDAHWADAATIDLLRALLQRGETARLLVLVSYRPAEVALGRHPLHGLAQAANRSAAGSRLALGGLSQEAIGQFLERRFAAEGARALAPLLERATGGNALFLGLMTEHLIERGWLDGTDGRWLHATPPEDVDLGMPASLREMIELEVVSAARGNIEVLEAAALVGERFTVEEVAAAAGVGAEAVDQTCHDLARAGHIVRFDDAAEQPTYEFIHALYRQVLAERVAPTRGRALHQRIGEHLEAEAAADLVGRAPLLAHHFGAAGDRARRARYLELSARNAAQHFAFREVRETLAHAIEAIRELPPSPERDLREADRLLDFANQSSIEGYAYANEGARTAFDRARELAEANGDVRLAFRAQLGRCYVRGIAGSDEAVPIVADLVATAERGHPELAAAAHTYATFVRHFRGEYRTAFAHSEAAMQMLPQAAAGVPALYDLTARLRAFRSSLLEMMGRPEEALAEHRLALERAKASSLVEMIEVILWRAFSSVLKDDVAETLVATDHGIEITAKHGLQMWVDTLRYYRAWALVRSQQAEVAELQAALAADSVQKSPIARELMPILLAEEHRRRGDLGAARRELEATTIVACRHVESERWRIVGQLLIDEAAAPSAAAAGSLGGGRSGEQCLQQSLEIAQSQGAVLFEQRTRTALASISGGREQARR